MKRLKRFIKLSWKGIPVGIIASVFLCVAVVAGSIYITTIQHITQEITPAVVYDYGTITAPDLALPSVEAGTSFPQYSSASNESNWVVVELGPDGVGKTLKITLTDPTLYTAYEIDLMPMETPANSSLVAYSSHPVDKTSLTNSIVLDKEGTYKFCEKINGRAGSTDGTADVEVTLTLEDS